MLHKLSILKLFISFNLLFLLMISTKTMAQQPSKKNIGKYLTGTSYRNYDTKSPDRSHNNRDKFRSIDGSNNNIKPQRRSWGAANSIFYRELSSNYGSENQNGALNDDNRPSAREISNLVCDEPVTQFNTLSINTMHYFWGQFIDHDMTVTPTGETEYVPIKLPQDEELFTVDIPFFRSEYITVNSQREQFNGNTAYLDASMVYGSDKERADWLRTFEGGKLKMSEDDYLPFNTLTSERNGEIDPEAPFMDDDEGGTVKVFVAGDQRASENTILTSLQVVFLREHNRICDELLSKGYTDDEKIYQIARKEVGAIIQAITYREYLPALGIELPKYRRYKSSVRPDIMNTFAAASFRIGHTQVSDDVVVVDNDCEEVGPGEFELVEAFFNTDLFLEYGPETFLKGATVHRLYKTDTKINDVLRDFLFGNVTDEIRFGLDLGSINIQRGRDHGLPDYNTARKHYTGRRARRFSDISSNDTVARNLESLYNDIDHIDLWVGLLSEDEIEGKLIGRTMSAMLSKQFTNLRDGDYYYYENDPFFSRSDRRRIQRTSLTDIIHRNTSLTSLFDDAFELDLCFGDGVPEDRKAINSVKVLASEENIKQVIYPSLVKDIINISFNETFENGIIEIYSLTGSLIKTKHIGGTLKTHQLDLSNFKSGIYIVKTKTDKHTALVTKIVKL